MINKGIPGQYECEKDYVPKLNEKKSIILQNDLVSIFMLYDDLIKADMEEIMILKTDIEKLKKNIEELKV